LPTVVLKSASTPTPTFQTPVVTLKSASSPTAVFCPKQTPGGFGHPAFSAGESAHQQSATATIKKPQRECERPKDLTRFFIRLVHLIGSCPVECVNCPPSPRGTGDSSKGMRSAREGSHSFDCIPAPIDLRSREAPVQGSHRVSLSEIHEGSRNVIKGSCIRPHFDASSKNNRTSPEAC
jgi:hypothetical protein